MISAQDRYRSRICVSPQEPTEPGRLTRFFRHHYPPWKPRPSLLGPGALPVLINISGGTVNFDAVSDDHKGDLQSSPLIPRMKRRIDLPEGEPGWSFPS